MPIVKSLKTPGGATIAFHCAQRVEAQVQDSAQVLMVSVASWPSVEDYDAAQGKSATWVDWHAVPFTAVATGAAEGLPAALEQALIGDASSVFYGGSFAAPHDDLPGAKARQWANVKQQRDMLDRAPVTLRDFQVDADESSRIDLMGALMAMQLSGQASRLWRCSDNVMRELTTADLGAIGQAIASRRQSLIEISDTLYQQIQAAQTVEDVLAVVWPSEPQ